MDRRSEAESYVEALRNIIGCYMPTTRFSVKLEHGDVEVAVDQDRLSFPATLLNDQDLSELSLALKEAINRSDDPAEELVLQLGYLTKSEESR